MSEDSVISTLRRAPLFATLSDEQLIEIARGSEVWLEPGEYLVHQGECRQDFYIVLDGHIEWTARVGQRDVHVLSHEAGMFFGHEPILLDIPVPVTGRALTAMHLYKWEQDAFWHILAVCPTITRELLTSVTQRFQTLEERSQQQAKLVSLGTLAAGLAHELNNPAAAVRRDAKIARERFDSVSARVFTLARQLTPAQLAFLADLPQNIRARALPAPLNPLEQSDREDEVCQWLDERGIADSWRLAPFLVEKGLDQAWLEELDERVPAHALEDALAWVEALVDGVHLLDEIEHGSERISTLIQAMKEYSFMDQAPLQKVDLHAGIESTLTILGHKLKGIRVTRDYASDVPPIDAYGSELNQVWTNIIDNAIDALGGSGHIVIRTAAEPERALVEISDDGPGIPPEVLPHIFEPFFTTKGVGKGTGLGLDISFQIVVETHHGDIRVESVPGNTRFQVRLPFTLVKGA